MNPLILVVEDEPPQVELLLYNLKKEGFRAISAGDGEGAHVGPLPLHRTRGVAQNK